MCFGERPKPDGGDARSRDLDRQIRQDEKRLAREVKLLLLGMQSRLFLIEIRRVSLPSDMALHLSV